MKERQLQIIESTWQYPVKTGYVLYSSELDNLHLLFYLSEYKNALRVLQVWCYKNDIYFWFQHMVLLVCIMFKNNTVGQRAFSTY